MINHDLPFSKKVILRSYIPYFKAKSSTSGHGSSKGKLWPSNSCCATCLEASSDCPRPGKWSSPAQPPCFGRPRRTGEGCAMWRKKMQCDYSRCNSIRWCNMMQRNKKIYMIIHKYNRCDAISCNMKVIDAIWCSMMQYDVLWCSITNACVMM